MSMWKGVFAALVMASLMVMSAQAGVVGTSTLVANPPVVNFAQDTGYNSAPLSDTWVSYILGAQTDDGSTISGFDVTITGAVNQRWNFDLDNEVFVQSASSTNATNGDSHLMIPATAIVFVPATENNNQPSPLPIAPDTGTRDYGIGTLLRGAWGIPGAEQSTSANFAYLVVPKGMEPEIDIHIELSTSPDQPIPLVVLDNNSFGGPWGGGEVDEIPPVIVPQLVDFTIDVTDPATLTNLQLTATDETTAVGDLTWSNLVYAGGPGQISGSDATMDADGIFNWNPNGWREGAHLFNATVADAAGNMTTGLALTVNLIVPEPASIALFGLALVGFAGFRRKQRS